MIRIWSEKALKTPAKQILASEEIALLTDVNIDTDGLLKDTQESISNYLISKYKMLGMFQIEDKELNKEDIKIYDIYLKIDKELDRLT